MYLVIYRRGWFPPPNRWWTVPCTSVSRSRNKKSSTILRIDIVSVGGSKVLIPSAASLWSLRWHLQSSEYVPAQIFYQRYQRFHSSQWHLNIRQTCKPLHLRKPRRSRLCSTSSASPGSPKERAGEDRQTCNNMPANFLCVCPCPGFQKLVNGFCMNQKCYPLGPDSDAEERCGHHNGDHGGAVGHPIRRALHPGVVVARQYPRLSPKKKFWRLFL